MSVPITCDHILHVMTAVRPSGPYSMSVELAAYMPSKRHTLLCLTDELPADVDMTVHAQGSGLDLMYTKTLTPAQLRELGGTSAILYNVRNPSIEDSLPSVYYSYGDWEPGTAPSAFPSVYASHHNRQGLMLPFSDGPIMPPMINTRTLRRVAGAAGPFTVAMLTSGNHDKYPGELVVTLAGQLNPSITLMFTELPKYHHPGVELAIRHTRESQKRRVYMCPVHPSGGLQFTVRADVLVYGTAPKYREPYGRLVVEAMAMGKAVVVERKGVFGTMLEHGTNALLFDKPGEAVEYVHMLEKDAGLRATLGANAQLWASWQDITVHVDTLKKLLR